MKGQISVNMNLITRPAVLTVNCNKPRFGLIKGDKVAVDVFGVYQVAIDDDVDAYFVVVLPNGQCTYASVESIRFVDCGVSE